MERYITIILSLVLLYSSCTNNNKGNERNDPIYEYKFYKDIESGLYVQSKFKKGSGVEVDTTFFYKDSLKKQLIEYNTLIEKNGNSKVNQVVRFKNDYNTIDTLNSYYFQINMSDQSIKVDVVSMFNDTMYIEIGELGNNYENIGRVDSFPFDGNHIVLTPKPYYKKARIGIWKKVPVPDSLKDQGGFMLRGKEMYIPKEQL